MRTRSTPFGFLALVLLSTSACVLTLEGTTYLIPDVAPPVDATLSDGPVDGSVQHDASDVEIDVGDAGEHADGGDAIATSDGPMLPDAGDGATDASIGDAVSDHSMVDDITMVDVITFVDTGGPLDVVSSSDGTVPSDVIGTADGTVPSDGSGMADAVGVGDTMGPPDSAVTPDSGVDDSGCGLSCTGGTTCCSVASTPMCIDLSTSVTNCGSCGNVCPTGAMCVGGTCECRGSNVLCLTPAPRCCPLGCILVLCL